MQPLNWCHRIDEIKPEGRSYNREATNAERDALVAALELVNCDVVSASYSLTALSNDRVSLTGQLRARGAQACVITLEPVAFELDVDVAVTFVPEHQDLVPSEDVEREALSLDDTEPYTGIDIDVGAVFYDHISSGLEPYPRLPGATMEALGGEIAENDQTPHPFAMLRKLKPKS